jgi:hypothetical protein
MNNDFSSLLLKRDFKWKWYWSQTREMKPYALPQSFVFCIPPFEHNELYPSPHSHQDYKNFSLIVWQLDELPCCHHVVGPASFFTYNV